MSASVERRTDEIKPPSPPAAPSARSEFERLAQLQALRLLIKTEEDKVRASLEARLRDFAQSNGATPKLSAKSVGMAYFTEPAEQVQIDDEAAWNAFCRQAYPERTSVRPRIDANRLLELARKDLRLTNWLHEGFVLVDEILLEDGLTYELGQRLPRTPEGQLLTEDGEILPAHVRPGGRQVFTVKIDKAAKERYAQELDSRMGRLLDGER